MDQPINITGTGITAINTGSGILSNVTFNSVYYRPDNFTTVMFDEAVNSIINHYVPEQHSDGVVFENQNIHANSNKEYCDRERSKIPACIMNRIKKDKKVILL